MQYVHFVLREAKFYGIHVHASELLSDRLIPIIKDQSNHEKVGAAYAADKEALQKVEQLLLSCLTQQVQLSKDTSVCFLPIKATRAKVVAQSLQAIGLAKVEGKDDELPLAKEYCIEDDQMSELLIKHGQTVMQHVKLHRLLTIKHERRFRIIAKDKTGQLGWMNDLSFPEFMKRNVQVQKDCWSYHIFSL